MSDVSEIYWWCTCETSKPSAGRVYRITLTRTITRVGSEKDFKSNAGVFAFDPIKLTPILRRLEMKRFILAAISGLFMVSVAHAERYGEGSLGD